MEGLATIILFVAVIGLIGSLLGLYIDCLED